MITSKSVEVSLCHVQVQRLSVVMKPFSWWTRLAAQRPPNRADECDEHINFLLVDHRFAQWQNDVLLNFRLFFLKGFQV